MFSSYLMGLLLFWRAQTYTAPIGVSGNATYYCHITHMDTLYPCTTSDVYKIGMLAVIFHTHVYQLQMLNQVTVTVYPEVMS